MTQTRQPFGTTPTGAPIEQVTIRGGGLTAQVLTYGAILRDLRLDGLAHPLVLGAPDVTPYFDEMTYFGAIVGRFANRIAGGRFEIDGVGHQIETNWLGRHSLHGGSVGTGQMLWRLEELQPDRVQLGLTLPDGDMGFPGTLEVTAVIALPGDGALQIDIRATTDAPTLCNFAHHSYFNLDGGTDITAHRLQIDAEAYLPVDADLIPTGVVAPVEGTAFDFRTARAVGRSGYDHNFCLNVEDATLREVASLHSETSGVTLRIETTEPGLQVYDGNQMPGEGIAGLDGQRYGPFAGIALETQGWPDAPNRSDFPAATLHPDEMYHHVVRYVFSGPADGAQATDEQT